MGKLTKDVLIDIIFIAIILSLFIYIRIILPIVYGVEHPLVAIEGYSMLPLFVPGDLVIEVKTGIGLGDVIVYKSCTRPGSFIIHRVVGIVEHYNMVYYVTKGDNNPDTDRIIGEFKTSDCTLNAPGIPVDRIEGVVVSVRLPFIGKAAIKIPILGGLALILKSVLTSHLFLIDNMLSP